MNNSFRTACLASTAAAVLIAGCGAAAAQTADGVTSTGITYGHLDGDGTADRTFGGLSTEFGLGPNYDVRLEFAFQNREEDTEFFSVGVGRDLATAGNLRLTVGTSNSDLGVYPELLIGLDHTYVGPADEGILLRSGLSYSDYEGNSESVNLKGEVVKYFPPSPGGTYLVGQLGGALTLSDPGSELGWDLNVAATVVHPSGWRYGASGSTGTIGYEGALALPVENDYVAVRPFVSRTIGKSGEIIARGEFVDTDNYDLKGMSVGLNFNF